MGGPEYSIGTGKGVAGLLPRLLFRRRNTRPRTNAAITATPPTEPPAMAPTLMLDLDDDAAAVVAEVIGPVEVTLVLMAEVVGLVEVTLVLMVEVLLVIGKVMVVKKLMLVLDGGYVSSAEDQ
jgi:hypothetical protein